MTDITAEDFGDADLRETVLAGLRFREANLVEADLRGVDLSGADLTAARLTGARIDIETAIAFAAAHGLRVDVDSPALQGP